MARSRLGRLVLGGPLSVAAALLVVTRVLAACGGKVADESTAGTAPTVIPSTPSPFDPGPPVTGPGPPTRPPPPPPVDASVPRGQLVGGSPQCSKQLPGSNVTCRTSGFDGYTPKCEYEVSSSDGGVCAWFCTCSKTTLTWMCNSPSCP